MLTNLYIENIAVIEKSNIDFTSGFNVLTGETGAGKSIVIDAINAVLGKRSSRGIIRTGADAAFVSATFEALSELTLKKLRAMGYEAPDGTLILSRELNASGKNTCRINARRSRRTVGCTARSKRPRRRSAPPIPTKRNA